LNTNLGFNRSSSVEFKFEGTLGGASSDYNLFQLFFDNVIIGSDEEKVDFFNKLAENNETLTNLIIKKDAIIDEINKIIDFLKDLDDEEV
jgi:hypothetical protein